MPRRRRKTSKEAEYPSETPASLPDARLTRRSPQHILRKLNALDEATQYLYGCSFGQFLDAAYEHAYHHGYKIGQKEGRAAGRRAAKGLPEARKNRGRPPKIDDSLISLLVFTADKRKQGESVKDAVRYFLKVMRAGAKELGTQRELPTEQEAIRAYYRHRKSLKKPLS